MAYDYKRYFSEIDVLRDITTMPREAKWRTAAPPREGERHQIVLYLGCNVFRTSHMIRTITAIFDRLGLNYISVGGPTYCCGTVHYQQGDAAAAGGMADNTIKLFERYQPEEVVMWCPSCIYFYDEVRHATLPYKVSHAADPRRGSPCTAAWRAGPRRRSRCRTGTTSRPLRAGSAR